MENNIDISVILMTYNHAPYVRKAIESILMQKTTARFEILVHDDASTDGTQEILKEYATRFHCIKLYLRKKKSINSNRSLYHLIRRAKGRYFAELEGDDFWIGEEKLETEYLFLENHAEYSAVYMDSITISEAGHSIKDISHYRIYDWEGRYQIQDYWYSGKYPGQTGTMMGRNIYLTCDATVVYRAHDIMGDISDIMLFAIDGPIYRINQVGSARRIVSRKGKSNWNSVALDRDLELERVRARIVLLTYFEKRTDNYALVEKRWNMEYEAIKKHFLDSSSANEIIHRGKILLWAICGMWNNKLHSRGKSKKQ